MSTAERRGVWTDEPADGGVGARRGGKASRGGALESESARNVSEDLRLAGAALGCWMSAFGCLHLSVASAWWMAAAGLVAALCGAWAGRDGCGAATTDRSVPPSASGASGGVACGPGGGAGRFGGGLRRRLGWIVAARSGGVAWGSRGGAGRFGGLRRLGWIVAARSGGAACGPGGGVGRFGGGLRRRLGWIVAAAALGVTCGAAATGARLAERDAQPLADLALRRATVQLGLVVTDDPRQVRGGVGRTPTIVVSARLTWLLGDDDRRIRLGARVLVLASDQSWVGLLPGQAVEARGRLAPARGGDLRAAVVSVGGAPSQVRPAPLVQRAAGTLRAGLQRACAPLPPEPGGLLPGLVVGDTSRLDPGLAEDFRSTGLTHLTAVSGANCAIVIGMVLMIARWCRAGPWLTALLCGAALIGFVVLARPSPSVLRAAAMGGLALIALAAGRPRAALPALATAVFVLVLVDPGLAVDAGFALSVLATGGLILLAPRWSAALRGRGVPAGVAEAVAVPAAAQAACAPVIAAISATVSMTTIPANLLAAPAVAPATILGVVAAVLSPLWTGGAEFVAWLASWPVRWLVLIAHRGAEVPDGVLPWPGGTGGGLLLGALLAALLIAARRPLVRRLVLVVAVGAVLGAVPVRVMTSGWPPPDWIAVACDVGQGDAVVLAAGGRAAVVVDVGPDPSAVDRCLRRLDVGSVPLLVLSHFHVDHVGGLDGVLRGRPVGRIVASPHPEPAAGRAAVLTRPVPLEPAVAGAGYTVGAVHVSVLGPARSITGTRSDPNNNSVVLRASIGVVSILLTGDAEGEQQADLFASLGADGLRADVLKVSHHGSAFQDPAFVAAVTPRVALVSVGAGNDYGHPNPALLAALARGGARVLRTDEKGDLAVINSDGRLAIVTRGLDPGRRGAHPVGPA